MQLKLLSLLCTGAFVLTGCVTPSSTHRTEKSTQTQQQPIVYTEPQVSAAYYALNPFNYNQPPEFEVNLVKAATTPVTKMIIKDPAQPDAQEIVLDKNRFIIPLVDSKEKTIKFAVLAHDNELDVTDIDDFLNILEGKARHYPTQFIERRERNGMIDKLKTILATLDQHALKPNASYDVLLRAAKANHMARNLDMGEQLGPKALSYANRLLKMKPKDAEVSFWLGFGLSEGGAFKEAAPYLKVAMDAGIQEAYLSSANNFLYMEQKKNAVTTLKNYIVKYPTEAVVINPLITEIEAGSRYNVWQIKK